MTLAASVFAGQAADFVSSTTRTKTLTVNVPAGATLFAGFAGDNNGTGTTTPDPSILVTGGGLTWNQIARGSGSAQGAGCVGALAYADVDPVAFPTGIASGTLITVTLNPAVVAKDIELWYVANSRVVSAISPVRAGDNSNATFSVSITPTAADQMVITWGSREASTNGTITPDADTTNGSWVSATPAGNTTAEAGGLAAAGITGFRAEKIVTAAGAQTWNPLPTGGGGDWVAFALVLEERPAASASSPVRARHTRSRTRVGWPVRRRGPFIPA